MIGSGIGTVLSGTTVESKGIRVPINPNLKDYYKTSVIQMSIMKDTEFTENSSIEIFRITDKNKVFVIDAQTETNTKIAKLRVRTSSGTAYSAYEDVKIFVNGQEDTPSNSVEIRYGQWNMISLTFQPLLDFSSFNGSIDITGPFIVNNIADYQVDKSRKGSSVVFAQWGAVEYSVVGTGFWSDIKSASPVNTWRDILIGEVLPVVIELDASEIYNSYLGNSKIETLRNFENLHSVDITQSDTTLYTGMRSSIINVIPL
jgi:hypothetical protein